MPEYYIKYHFKIINNLGDSPKGLLRIHKDYCNNKQIFYISSGINLYHGCIFEQGKGIYQAYIDSSCIGLYEEKGITSERLIEKEFAKKQNTFLKSLEELLTLKGYKVVNLSNPFTITDYVRNLKKEVKL